jgi:UDP-N-acetyl-D-galactosamine dehydrogenase
MADPDDAIHEYGVRLVPITEQRPVAAVVEAVAQRQFLDWSPEDFCGFMKDNPVLIDVKGMYDRSAIIAAGIRVWRM